MILAIIEHDRGIISPYSLQLLTYAHKLAGGDSTNVKAVVIGQNVHALTSELSKYSPDEKKKEVEMLGEGASAVLEVVKIFKQLKLLK